MAGRGLDHVYFAQGEVKLSPEMRDMLLAQVYWLKSNTSARIAIEGHADDPGSDQHNIALGWRRAGAVHEFLLTRGIRRDRIASVVSCGRGRPVVRCGDDNCRPRNRRVQTREIGMTVLTAWQAASCRQHNGTARTDRRPLGRQAG